MEILFKFPPINKTYSISCNQPTLLDNKHVFFGALINNEKCLKQIVDNLTKLIASSNQSSFAENEIEILKEIKSKLESKLNEEDQEDDNSGEEQFAASERNGQEDSQRLTEEERHLLISSIQFNISGETMSEEKEQKPISSLNIVKNSTIVMVRLNFMQGFDSKSKIATHNHHLKQELPDFFKCKEHRNEKCTHYCKTCSKMICVFDILPNSRENPEKTCKNHEVITLEEQQLEKKDEILKQKQELEKRHQEVLEQNQHLKSEFELLNEKSTKNSKQLLIISENLKEIEEIISRNKENSNQFDYLNLEKMTNTTTRLKATIDGIVVEKNENHVEMERDMQIRKQKMMEMNQSITVLKSSDAKKDETIKTLQNEIHKTQADNSEKTEKFERILQRMKEFSQKHEKVMKITKKYQQILTDQISNPGGIIGNEESDKIPQTVNVAIICDRDESDSAYLRQNLEKGNQLLKVTYCKKFSELGAQKDIQTRNWDQEHVFLIFNSSTKFPSWLGDFLFEQHKLGKGIVLSADYTFAPDLYGICGMIENEVPILKGKCLQHDGPKSMVKLEEYHQILENVENFDGGRGSFRAKIKCALPKSFDEQINVLATWDDQDKTPMIIAKRNFDVLSGGGNIVVLNFYPLPNKKYSTSWDVTSDGHTIMQNSILWAGKAYIQKKMMKLMSGKPIQRVCQKTSEFLEMVKQIIQ